MANIKYIETISTSLDGIEKKFGQMLICSDTKEIYYDNSDTVRINMNSIIQVESNEELNAIINPIPSKIYLVKSNGKLYIHLVDHWRSINDMSKTMVFYLGKTIKTGMYPIMLQVPDDAIISSLTGLCVVPGATINAKLDIIVCQVSKDPLIESNWVSLFNTDKQFIIPYGAIKGNTAYELNTLTLTKGDLIKVNIMEADKTISGITLNINLAI